jgi:hypothetical protein
MGYKVLGDLDKRFQPRKGLDGPFYYPNGRVLYYDPKQGQYYDSTTDIYVEKEEISGLQQDFLHYLGK